VLYKARVLHNGQERGASEFVIEVRGPDVQSG
jgi:hypothetical protein